MDALRFFLVPPASVMAGAVYFPGGSFFPDAGLERASLEGEKGTIAPDDAKFPGTKAAAGGFIVIFRIVL